jgi:hypothetical protein
VTVKNSFATFIDITGLTGLLFQHQKAGFGLTAVKVNIAALVRILFDLMTVRFYQPPIVSNLADGVSAEASDVANCRRF